MPIQIALLTKNMSVEEYGLLNLIVSTSVMATIVFSLGLQSYAAISIPKHTYSRQLFLFKNMITFQIFNYILFGALTMAIISYFDLINLTNKELLLVFITYLLFLIINETGKFYSYMHQIHIRLILGILELLSLVFVLYLFVKLVDDFSLIYVFYTYLSVYLSIFLIYLYIFKNKKKFFKVKLRKSLIQKAIYFSIPLIFSDIAWRSMQNIDSYLLIYYGLDYDLGIYSFNLKIINVLYLISSPILWILYPYLVKYFSSEKMKFEKLLSVQIKYTSLITFIGLGFFLINANELVLLISNNEYAKSIDNFYIIAIYPILLLFIYLIYQMLMIEKKKNIIMFAYLTGLTFNTVFSFILIKAYGIHGAFISTIVGLSATLIYLFYYLNRKYKILFIRAFLVLISLLFVTLCIILISGNKILLNISFIVLSLVLLYIYNVYAEILYHIKKYLK